jgi:hypothetical protein
MKAAPVVMHLESELQTLELGDARRNQRHRRIVDAVTRTPAASFPHLTCSKAELEALYRHFNNPEVSLPRCLAPHARATVDRCQQEGLVLVAHDTTEVDYRGEGREGLGLLGGDERGYFAHVSLAMTADGLRRPLGVMAVDTWVRPEPKVGQRKKQGGKQRFDDPTKESMCWTRNLEATEGLLEGKASVIHLLDRGGDSYDLLVRLSRCRFVARANHDRNVYDEQTDEVVAKLREASATQPVLLEREVRLSERLSKSTPRTARTHPPRRSRLAKLEVRATRVTLRRPPGWSKQLPEYLSLHLVHVTERDRPDGQEPVEWVLYTSEPIETAEQVAFVVDCYRSRWLIDVSHSCCSPFHNSIYGCLGHEADPSRIRHEQVARQPSRATRSLEPAVTPVSGRVPARRRGAPTDVVATRRPGVLAPSRDASRRRARRWASQASRPNRATTIRDDEAHY